MDRKRTRGAVFMAWGTPAGKRVAGVNTERHLVLRAVHPSPLSAMRGYLTCGHYRKANEWLVKRYGDGGDVDWSLTEGVSVRSSKPKKLGESEGVDEVGKGESEEGTDGDGEGKRKTVGHLDEK